MIAEYTTLGKPSEKLFKRVVGKVQFGQQWYTLFNDANMLLLLLMMMIISIFFKQCNVLALGVNHV